MINGARQVSRIGECSFTKLQLTVQSLNDSAYSLTSKIYNLFRRNYFFSSSLSSNDSLTHGMEHHQSSRYNSVVVPIITTFNNTLCNA
jgi:hypothetical protein